MEGNYANYCLSIEYVKGITIEHFDPARITLQKANFITENSRDIALDSITFASLHIDRATYAVRLANLLNDISIAIAIEMSIYEYALIHATLHSIERILIPAIYDDKFVDIFMNLDETSRLNNQTLKSGLLQGGINPKFIAFLSPDQMHPESWRVILEKVKFREKTESNMATTDAFKCYKCGEKKCKLNEIQLRSADESSTKIITCLICYNTWQK